MKKTDTVLFLNPSSHSYKASRRWPYFRSAGLEEIISKSADDLVQQVAQSPCKTAVAVGGDGTINLVINGIMQSSIPKELGVLYAGTSPDFCQFHGVSTQPSAALQQFLSGTPRAIDLCRITYPNGKCFYFASSCNIGLGAEVARLSNKIRRYVGDFWGTLLACIKALVCVKPFSATLHIDGKVHTFNHLRHLVILKNKFLASGLYLDVPAQPDDGFIYVVALPRLTLNALFHIYKGGIPPGAYLAKCREVSVETYPTQATEFDGDPKPVGNVQITCLQQCLELIK